MNMEINKKTIIMLAIFGLLLIVAAIIMRLSKNENVTENKEEESIAIVKNYNDFYTVNSCIYRYITFVKNKDANTLMKLLDDEFIKSNNINSTNLFNYLNTYEGNISFNSRKMYEEKVSNDITKYYVFGYVEKDIIDSLPEQQEAYFVVKMDSKNKIFTIMPYSGELFK